MAEIFNQAQLSYNSTVISSNVTVGELLPALSLTKTAVGSTYGRGSDVTYIISLMNMSANEYSGVTVTDNLGAYTSGTSTLYPLEYVSGTVRLYENGILGDAPAVSAGPPLVFSGITVPANGNVILVYKTEVTEFAPLDVGSQITNTATASYACNRSLSVSDSETVSVTESPDIAITKHMEPTTVIECDTVTYTFVIENYGNTALTAEYGSVLTDTFTPPLTDITVTYNGTVRSSATNYTYSEITGAFATLPGQITVPAATFHQDPVTGIVSITPGSSTLVITGTI